MKHLPLILSAMALASTGVTSAALAAPASKADSPSSSSVNPPATASTSAKPKAKHKRAKTVDARDWGKVAPSAPPAGMTKKPSSPAH